MIGHCQTKMEIFRIGLSYINAHSASINLKGWFLTDDPIELDKWEFPTIIIPPGSYMVAFASNKNRHVRSFLHTNFKLNSNGEFLALVAPDGKTIVSRFAPVYPSQTADISYSLTQNGSFRYFAIPTPGRRNGTSSSDFGPSIPMPTTFHTFLEVTRI